MSDFAQSLENLLNAAQKLEILDPADLFFARNAVLAIFPQEKSPHLPEISQEKPPMPPGSIAQAIKPFLPASLTLTEQDLLETRISGALMDRPSAVIEKFRSLSPEGATAYLYTLMKNVNYIKTDRIAKNIAWNYPSEFGDLQITINLSKPEKDPRDIAKALEQPSNESAYPKCLLCPENEGFAGNLTQPPRQNIRLIPLDLAGDPWSFQYSPYSYYNEHCIILDQKHTPMQITAQTFRRMSAFLEQFPHYFVGSNTDIPIVGGSILTHDHFQGGKHVFPMDLAAPWHEFEIEGLRAELLQWPLSVIRLKSESLSELSRVAFKILQNWSVYSDPLAGVLAAENGVRRNAITPIARKNAGVFEFDLVLRNNRASQEFPDGIFHPHQQWHHIKKENIGLIEVLGLAILPGRLAADLEQGKYSQDYIGSVFANVLKDAGVFKQDPQGKEAFLRYITQLGE